MTPITAAIDQNNKPTLIGVSSTDGSTPTRVYVNPSTGRMLVDASGSSEALIVGTTTITSGTNTYVEYNNNGVLGEYPITGSGNVVLSTSPTLVAPTLGAASGTSLNLSGLTASEAVQTDASKNLVSVANTGTGNNVLSISPAFTGSPTAPTQTALNNSTIIATTAYVDTQASDNAIKAYQYLGSVIKGQTVGVTASMMSNTLGLVNQTARFTAVYLPTAQTITGVKWNQVTQGSYTGNNNNYVALYSYSAGTLTQVAISTNSATLWSTFASGTIGNVAFSSSYSAQPGVYYVASLYCESAQTTASVLGAISSATNAISNEIDFTNSATLVGTLASQTSLPSPTQAMSGVTPQVTQIWFGLY